MYTNSQILAAVLTKWAQPALEGLIGSKMGGLPFLANIEAKMKSTGFVSPMWSLGKEIAPIFNGVANSLIEPILTQYLKNIPEEAIPQLAHNVVRDAIKNGGLKRFDGNVEFEVEDLEELQTLLRYNLPIQEQSSYKVLDSEPTSIGAEKE